MVCSTVMKAVCKNDATRLRNYLTDVLHITLHIYNSTEDTCPKAHTFIARRLISSMCPRDSSSQNLYAIPKTHPPVIYVQQSSSCLTDFYTSQLRARPMSATPQHSVTHGYMMSPRERPYAKTTCELAPRCNAHRMCTSQDAAISA